MKVSKDTTTHPGLRNVLIYVTLDGVFPPVSNSAGDIALLRAANLAMRRKAQGIVDVSLFVMGDPSSSISHEEAIKAYGFPAAEIVYHDDEPQPGDQLPDSDALREDVGNIIGLWLTNAHSGAIAYVHSSYVGKGFWWTGVEHADRRIEWPFATADFAAQLPAAHRNRAETWLAVLANDIDWEDTPLGEQRAALMAATLCEWLHGFEAASGNGFNDFDPSSTITALGISDFLLGYEAARLTGSDLQEFCDEHDKDIDALGEISLPLITSDLRSELRRNLSDRFGGNSELFWALYSAIWPKLSKSMDDAFAEILNEGGYEELAELESPWSFVTDGWCDAADS